MDRAATTSKSYHSLPVSRNDLNFKTFQEKYPHNQLKCPPVDDRLLIGHSTADDRLLIGRSAADDRPLIGRLKPHHNSTKHEQHYENSTLATLHYDFDSCTDNETICAHTDATKYAASNVPFRDVNNQENPAPVPVASNDPSDREPWQEHVSPDATRATRRRRLLPKTPTIRPHSLGGKVGDVHDRLAMRINREPEVYVLLLVFQNCRHRIL